MSGHYLCATMRVELPARRLQWLEAFVAGGQLTFFPGQNDFDTFSKVKKSPNRCAGDSPVQIEFDKFLKMKSWPKCVKGGGQFVKCPEEDVFFFWGDFLNLSCDQADVDKQNVGIKEYRASELVCHAMQFGRELFLFWKLALL